jgi:predicted GNAT family N-acyltransferase
MFRIAVSPADRLKAHIVRGIVFIEGQACPYDEEIDEHEDDALHILGELDGQPVAAARIRFLDDWAKLERIAVREAYRGRNIGSELVEYMLALARDRRYHKFKMHAQSYLSDYYAKFGFVRHGELFQEAGIDHYLMILEDH